MSNNYGNEYKKFLKRKGRPYSDAHSSKYRIISEFLKEKPANILEIGPGLGVGLEKLLKKDCIKRYFGVEAVKDCFDFLNKKFKKYDKSQIYFIHKDWMDISEEKVRKYFKGEKVDFSLCIEVIEHNKDSSKYLEFLTKIHNLTKRVLFYSTPSKEGDKHGKLRTEESLNLLKHAGFQSVSIVAWRGTPFYICNPKGDNIY